MSEYYEVEVEIRAYIVVKAESRNSAVDRANAILHEKHPSIVADKDYEIHFHPRLRSV